MKGSHNMMVKLVAVLRVGCSCLLVLVLGTSGMPAYATALIGAVVGVADGDTLTVLDATKVQHKIRLAGIDAPEKKQAFGNKAKQALSDAAYGKLVTVETHKKDRYGRHVGRVVFDGQDVGLWLVHQGLAWHYKAYEQEQPPEERMTYASAELRARKLRRGLWVDPSPVPPWEYRRR